MSWEVLWWAFSVGAAIPAFIAGFALALLLIWALVMGAVFLFVFVTGYNPTRNKAPRTSRGEARE